MKYTHLINRKKKYRYQILFRYRTEPWEHFEYSNSPKENKKLITKHIKKNGGEYEFKIIEFLPIRIKCVQLSYNRVDKHLFKCVGEDFYYCTLDRKKYFYKNKYFSYKSRDRIVREIVKKWNFQTTKAGITL